MWRHFCSSVNTITYLHVFIVYLAPPKSIPILRPGTHVPPPPHSLLLWHSYTLRTLRTVHTAWDPWRCYRVRALLRNAPSMKETALAVLLLLEPCLVVSCLVDPWLIDPLTGRPLPDRSLCGRLLSDRPLTDRPLPDRPLPDRSFYDRPLPDRSLSDRPLPDWPLTGFFQKLICIKNSFTK